MPACVGMINTRVSNSETFNTWKAITSTEINSISPTAAAGTVPPSAEEMNKLITASADVFNTVACIQEKISELEGSTNAIHRAQETILSLNEEISKAEEDVAIARDRVSYIRHPEEHTSFYESWFPITRPMTSSSVPFFVGVVAFIVIFGVLIFLSYLGLEVNINVTPGLVGFTYSIADQFTFTTVLLIILLATVLYYFMYMKQK
jgi:hypothetical protein